MIFFFEKILLIFDIENWFWKYDFGTFWQTGAPRILKIQRFPLSISILGQKACILGPTIFKIPQPNWHYSGYYKIFQTNYNNCTFKANVSQEILNWHSLRHSHSADICIHFYCLSWLRQARQRKMIQSSALWLCLRLCRFKISWDT